MTMKTCFAALLSITGSLMLADASAAAPAAASAPATSPHGVAAPTVLTPLPRQDKLTIRGWSAPAPAAWTPVQPMSGMRSAQFILPGADKSGKRADDGEMVAYFFPTGDGGSQQANIERWSAEVTDAAGKPVKPQISKSKSGMTMVTVLSLQGNYMRGANMLPGAQRKSDQTLLVAMVETSIGRITLQAHGPSKTVAAHRDSFLKLASSFAPG